MNKTLKETREMKDSGIGWIGEIPQEWELAPLKAILKERKEKNLPIKTTNILSLTIDKGVIPYSEKSGGGNKAKEDLTAYKLAYPNDIVLNSMNVIAGSVGLSKYFGAISPVYYTLYTNEYRNHISYFNNIFQTQAFQKSLMGLGNGIMIKESGSGKLNTIRLRISMEKLKGVMLPVPPLHEQQVIANYLDEQVEKIDGLISEQKQAIEKWKEYKQSLITETVTQGLNPNVEMKDSGIEWIGKIPNEWSINRGKFILKLLKRPIKESDEVITCFRDGEVTLRSNRREDGFTFSLKEIGYQGIEPDDLVIHGMDGFAGAIGISDSRGKGSPVLNVCDALFGCKKYYMYYLRTLAINNVFLALATGIRERSCDLRWNKVANLEFVIPPFLEQQAITEFLDEKCLKIDQTIEQKEMLINHLEEYKQSLIYECVTGKRCVL